MQDQATQPADCAKRTAALEEVINQTTPQFQEAMTEAYKSAIKRLGAEWRQRTTTSGSPVAADILHGGEEYYLSVDVTLRRVCPHCNKNYL